jgi:alpha-L-fucosidase
MLATFLPKINTSHCESGKSIRYQNEKIKFLSMNTNRRIFLQKTVAASLLPFAGMMPAFASPLTPSSPEASPSAAQRAFMAMRFGMFIHFGINTYYNEEWTDGTKSPSVYNPNELDTDQWCRLAKSAGMKYVVFTTKHHEGFCNWPTKHTTYSVKSTPFKHDVVKMLSASCQKYDLKLGLYYSLWDRHEPTYKDDYAYTEFMKGQLKELLTGYGTISLIWFDGAWDKCPEINKGDIPKEKIQELWRNEGAFRWQMDHLYSYIKHLQPECLVMNNSAIHYSGIPFFPTDVRSGERADASTINKKTWSFAGAEMYLPMQIETTISNLDGHGYWFNRQGDTSARSKEEIKGLLQTAASIEANLLLNCGPMRNGKLRPEDEKLLLSLQR